ncbi:hypothetical protein CkaCkLH20_10859 [Colletotrichum karsti]|uniref:Vacuolar ATPase assembly protein VMA22 n=1 Tax=Colletotrichum karsti TaxID=1095194 RepID=A0A9P6HYW1_9PEZI|nr:uncharacterized protein CkaCkLH20_10859 [Colletotrichum karsti]KAF9871661.1 hypothetical protein CkaCkLH20_10859 [Colletotrichum karsti]
MPYEATLTNISPSKVRQLGSAPPTSPYAFSATGKQPVAGPPRPFCRHHQATTAPDQLVFPSASALSHNMETNQIDQLLERYLVLLDEYTVLRELLSKTQAAMYQNIARANFSAERGVRYGPDYYDERMQASRILSISAGSKDVPRFELVKPAEAVTDPGPHEAPVDEGKPDDLDEAPADGPKSDEKPEDTTKTAEEKKKKRSNDPLRWFGILAPMPLRQAQTLSVKAVQDVIPRLVSINAEMMDLEIEVRRARKKRAKAEAAHSKIDAEDGQEPGRHESRVPVTTVEST